MDNKFIAFLELLYKPRNTIHAAALRALSYHESGKLPTSYIEIPKDIEKDILDNAQKYSSLGDWGIDNLPHTTFFDPYTYASSLVNYGLEIIDKLADATDLSQLFPPDYSLSYLKNDPSKDNVLSPFYYSHHIGILG